MPRLKTRKLRPPNARWWPASSSHPGQKIRGGWARSHKKWRVWDSTKVHTFRRLWFQIHLKLWGSELVDQHELPPISDPTVVMMDPTWKKWKTTWYRLVWFTSVNRRWSAEWCLQMLTVFFWLKATILSFSQQGCPSQKNQLQSPP